MSSTAASAKSSKQTKYIVLLWAGLLVMIFVPTWMFFSKLSEAIRQHHINQTYIPTDATIISSEVQVRHGSKGHLYYVPVIFYRYQVGGTAYTSQKVTPIYSSHTQQWSEATVNRFKRGQTCRAFRDPSDPSQATLILGYSFSPYLSMLGLAFFVTVGSFMLLRTRCELPRDPIKAQNGWFELKPMLSQMDRLRIATICASAWYAYGAVAAFHYFSVFPRPTSSPGVNYFIGFALIGVIPVGFVVRYFSVTKNLSDARLFVDTPAAELGQTLRFTIRQSAAREIKIGKTVLSLRCVKITGQGKQRRRHTVYESTVLEAAKQTLLLGQKLDLKGEITFPSDQPPTGKDAQKKSTWIQWELYLHSNIAHAPAYKATFPVTVIASRADENKNSASETRANS